MNALRFSKGEKIVLKPGRAVGRYWRNKAGRVGTVVGYSRDRQAVRVVFDGLKTPEAWHHERFERAASVPVDAASPAVEES